MDVLEALLMSLNNNHARLQAKSNKEISALKYNIAVKNNALREKKETIHQKQGEITKLAATILNHHAELKEKDLMG